MEVPIPFWILVFFSFDKYPEVELLGHMVVHCFFIFLRNLHTLFLIAVPVYILTNSVLSFPFSPFSENLLFVVFLMIAILTGGRSFLMVALICLSVMFNDVQHLFTCLLVMCVTSSKIYAPQIFSGSTDILGLFVLIL